MPTRILFVDDEPDLELLIRQKYRKQLRRKEVACEFASNGREALRKIDSQPQGYDLIITDINMPEMNGLELLAELSRRELSCVILVLSAYGDMANIRAAMNQGAFDFLTKPIDFEDLAITRDKALRHLGAQRQQAQLEQDKERLERRARFIRETFGRYLSDSVVQTILDDPQGLRLGGERREVSILMSDLRGFTALCERLSPEQTVSMLNAYFGAMIDVVMAHGGTIDELLGDAMLLIFGAPLPQADHADRAVRCAIEMQRAMIEVNQRNAAEGLPALEMGIAVNTGEAVVGNIGSRKRSKYGVVGSHVNLTARIEALTMGHQVLISEDTRRACCLPLVLGEELTFMAKGFEEPVKVHDLRGLRDDPRATLPPHAPGPRAAPVPRERQVTGPGLVQAERITTELPAQSSELAPPAVSQQHLATLGLMVAGVAHDIRGPLGFIVNFAEISAELGDEVIDEVSRRVDGALADELVADLKDLKANVERIKEHGVRASDLVQSMQRSLRGAPGPARDIALNVVLARHLELFELSMRAAEPSLELVIGKQLDDDAGHVKISPQELSRVVLNLVQNACDAARARKPDGAPPRVLVKTARQGDRVELRVLDNGVGISHALRSRIFDPFVTTKGLEDGMGLGLALTREIVEAAGGTISFETEEGRFAEFIVSLPRLGG